MAEAERQRYGYTTESGERVSALRDMFDGGGPGRSGPRFEGGGIISDIGNAMGGPSMFGFGGEGGNRSATLGRMAGGMMFGPLGMIGGGILGNMLGGGMRQAPAPAPVAAPAMAPVPRPSPAAIAMRPVPRPWMAMDPYKTAPAAQPAPTFPVSMPGAVERFVTGKYGMSPDQMLASYQLRPPLPGAVPYNLPTMTFDPLTGLPVVMAPPRVQ